MADIHYRLSNVDRFNRSLVAIVANGRLGVVKQMEKRAKILFEKVIDATPPGGRGIRGIKAKQKGMRTVEGEIRKVIMGVNKPRDPNPGLTDGQLHYWHNKARVGGRVRGQPRKGNQLLVTSKSKLNDYIRKRQKAIGMLAAGWNHAARKFKVPARAHPKWISRHNPGGLALFWVTKKRITVRGINAARHVGKVGRMRMALDEALERAAWDNEKVMNSYKKEAKRQGFRVR